MLPFNYEANDEDGKMGRIIAGLLVLSLLSACQASIRGPSAEIELPKVKIFSGGGFCPPGQAKKGRC